MLWFPNVEPVTIILFLFYFFHRQQDSTRRRIYFETRFELNLFYFVEKFEVRVVYYSKRDGVLWYLSGRNYTEINVTHFRADKSVCSSQRYLSLFIRFETCVKELRSRGQTIDSSIS